MQGPLFVGEVGKIATSAWLGKAHIDLRVNYNEKRPKQKI
jgi:hypothetical protein